MLVSQASSLGVNLSLGILILVGINLESSLLTPALGAVLCALFVYFISQRAAKKWRSKATSILLSIFVMCLSLSYIVTSVFPALESHFASSFLGDIATTSGASSWYLSALSILCIGIFVFLRRRLLLQSFWVASADTVFSKKLELIFYALVAVLVIESTRLLGFLLTVSSLVILPLCVSIFARKSTSYLIYLVSVAATASVAAFVFSLKIEKLPTSAVIAITQGAFGIALVFFKGFFICYGRSERV
jgi:zinc/manganese transport system permease protein/iron/zinc/copper transport system permease protein